MTSLDEVIAALLLARQTLDRAAITVTRSHTDASQAHHHLRETGHGTTDPALTGATIHAAAATESTARYAQHLAQAAEHLTTYLNTIAPGSTPAQPAADATPTGEQLVTDAERRARRADAAWRKQTQKADDGQDALKNIESSSKEVFSFFKRQIDGQGGSSAGTTTQQPPPTQERPQLDNPVTAAVMAAGALAVVAKAMWKHSRTRRAIRRNPDDQP